MLVPFGTRVLDSAGKAVGTVSRLVLHRDSREVAGLVVHQGVVDRREIVVPIGKVAAVGEEVRLALRSAELAGLDLYRGEQLQAVPDHWDMPMGFDERDFFLVVGGGWTEGVLPFEKTSPAVAGTPAYVHDRDTVAIRPSPTSRRACTSTAAMGTGWATSRLSNSTRPPNASHGSLCGGASSSSARPASPPA